MMIRDARPAEAAQLAELVAPQPLLQRYQVTAERLAADLGAAVERGQVIVVEEEGAAVGFA